MKQFLKLLGVFTVLVQTLAATQNSWAQEQPAVVRCELPDCKVTPIFTVGESIGQSNYMPPGRLDGTGAYKLNKNTVRVFVNHEISRNDSTGSNYKRGDRTGVFELEGARVSYFDFNMETLKVLDSGVAFSTIYNASGNPVSDNSFLPVNSRNYGFDKFCSANLFEPFRFGRGRGFVDRIFMTNEESSLGPGGAFWALNPEDRSLWHVSALGRGKWESSTQLDTGSPDKVALILSDDESPYDVDSDGIRELAPLYLYVGIKDKSPDADFLARNGLRNGKIYVWVADNKSKNPSDFRGKGSLSGRWMELDTSGGTPSENGGSGFDEYGNPGQVKL